MEDNSIVIEIIDHKLEEVIIDNQYGGFINYHTNNTKNIIKKFCANILKLFTY